MNNDNYVKIYIPIFDESEIYALNFRESKQAAIHIALFRLDNRIKFKLYKKIMSSLGVNFEVTYKRKGEFISVNEKYFVYFAGTVTESFFKKTPSTTIKYMYEKIP